MNREIILKKKQGQHFAHGFKHIDRAYNIVTDSYGVIHKVNIPENKSHSLEDMNPLGFSFTQIRKLHGVLIDLCPENSSEIILLIEGN